MNDIGNIKKKMGLLIEFKPFLICRKNVIRQITIEKRFAFLLKQSKKLP